MRVDGGRVIGPRHIVKTLFHFSGKVDDAGRRPWLGRGKARSFAAGALRACGARDPGFGLTPQDLDAPIHDLRPVE